MQKFAKTAAHKATPSDYSRAAQLRKNPTNGEAFLWHDLRAATKTDSFRFRRQHPIHPYIVDFVCLKLKLIIEIDGTSHNLRQREDLKREKYLIQAGYKVLRFTNDDVLNNRDGVVTIILNFARNLQMGIYIPLP